MLLKCFHTRHLHERWNRLWATFFSPWNSWSNFNKTQSHSSGWHWKDAARVAAQSGSLTEKFGTSNDNVTFWPSSRVQRVHGDSCSLVCILSATFHLPRRENSGLTNTWFDLTEAQLGKMWIPTKCYFIFESFEWPLDQNTCVISPQTSSLNASVLFLFFICELGECLGGWSAPEWCAASPTSSFLAKHNTLLSPSICFLH